VTPLDAHYAAPELDEQDRRALGVLLIEMFNRIQTINPKDAHSAEVLAYIDSNLSKLESLPSLPKTVQTSSSRMSARVSRDFGGGDAEK